ncbi:MAG: single-stranded DNA-binding protein [Clostridia bacterium]|nr:single-stranded DNA-binding protein [Clostridia bacterium]
MFTYSTRQEKDDANQVYLSGEIVSQPVFSHEVFGEAFYEAKLKVPRLSQAYDLLPITVSERLTCNQKLFVGQKISLKGQLRSFNKQVNEKSKLLLSVFVRELLEYDEQQNPNNIQLNGFLCKTPIFRTTPFNREICDLLLAVNRAYNKSDYIPAIAWGRNARFVKFLPIGQEVVLSGRLQSREYQKKLSDNEIEIKTAYEVSVVKIMLKQDKSFYSEDELLTEEVNV